PHIRRGAGEVNEHIVHAVFGRFRIAKKGHAYGEQVILVPMIDLAQRIRIRTRQAMYQTSILQNGPFCTLADAERSTIFKTTEPAILV
ncbi:MAG: hypothetical protein AMJ65_12610, partial [Phycisphaerae bacterium SG8_4]